jgi:hypothetical protein
MSSSTRRSTSTNPADKKRSVSASNSNSNPPQPQAVATASLPPPPPSASEQQQVQLEQLLASFTGKGSSWVGSMSFDVNSARLQYARALVGENRMAINSGDTVMFVAASGAGDASVRFGRVKALYHNPRGEAERTAAIAESIQLGAAASGASAAGSPSGTTAASSPTSAGFVAGFSAADAASALSRLVLNIDARPVGGVLRATTLEVPITHILARVELRDANELLSESSIFSAGSGGGACIACFLRHTPGISPATCLVDWTRMAPGAMSQVDTSAATAGLSLTQSANAASAATGAPVLVTCGKLRQAVVDFNEAAAAVLSAAAGSAPAAQLRRAAALRREVEAKMSALVGRSLSQHQQQVCSACRTSLSRASSAPGSAAAAVAAVAATVAGLTKRLLLDVGAELLAFEKEEEEKAAAQHQAEQLELEQQRLRRGQSAVAAAADRRRGRDEDDDPSAASARRTSTLLVGKAPLSQQQSSSGVRRRLSASGSSLAVGDTDLRLLIVADRSKFKTAA